MFCFECIKMNQIVIKILLAGDKATPKIYLKQPCFTGSSKKELKKLCRQEMQILFTKMIFIKFVLNMIWLMINQKIEQKELNQTKFEEIMHLN